MLPRSWSMHRPCSTRAIVAIAALTLLPRGEAAAEGHAEAAEVVAAEVAGTVFYSKAAVREEVRRHRRAIARCFEEAWSREGPEAVAGRYVVQFQIGPAGGAPAAVELIEATNEGSSAGRCIESAFERMEFRPPEEGGVALVRYPIELPHPSDHRIHRALGGPGFAPYATTLSDRIRYRGERPRLSLQGAAGAGQDGVARLEGAVALGVTEWFELRLRSGELDRPLTGAPRYAAGFKLSRVGKHRAGNGVGAELSYGWDGGEGGLRRLKVGLLASDTLGGWLQADVGVAMLVDSGPVDERAFAPAVRLGFPLLGALSSFLEGSVHLRKGENRAIGGLGLAYLLREGLLAGAAVHAGAGEAAPVFRLGLATELDL